MPEASLPRTSRAGEPGGGSRRRAEFLSFSPPSIGDEEIREVVDTLRSDWITTGPKAARFEREFAAYLDAPGALALNSCTAALHTTLAALKIGPGDEVISTPMTFGGTVNVIEHCGARPVLVDVEPDTLNIDPAGVETAITDRTRAIIPVHYAGHPVELDEINDVAQRHGLTVVEDAAHALPAAYRGRPIGATTNPAAFSFYATKNLTTGEGGMLTGDPVLLDRCRVLSQHGMSRDATRRYIEGGDWFYEVLTPGFKYNMTDIQAAIGIRQLEKLESFQERRRAIVGAYHEAFRGHNALQIPVQRAHVDSAWHLYVLRLNLEALTINRDRFIRELTQRNIGTSVHFIPIHLHPYYRDKYGYRSDDFPIAYENYRRMISLPLYPRLSDGDVADVIDAVLDTANTFKR
jgi:dTDP-4-amino-4,6-dideoxygalactose transaminase